MGIIGNNFNKYVRDQINVRQEAMGKGLGYGESLINPKFQQPFITSTPWMRLASGVKITEGDKEAPGTSVYDQILESGLLDGIGENTWKNNGLAALCVLQGSMNSVLGTGQPRGVVGVKTQHHPLINNDPNNPYPEPFIKAYGWGYNEGGIKSGQGYVPPPGVTAVDFEYKNDGALAFATISIKAFSAEQFSIIDILYMRPGYTCLLEFGHSQYLDNLTQEVKNLDNSSSTPLNYLFGNSAKDKNFIPSYNQMARKISKEKQKHDGNYEGFFGRISKFNWKFNSDGSYDITVKLTGIGDVIQSLKTTLPKMTEKPTSYSNKFTPTPGLVDLDEAEEAEEFICSDIQLSQLNFELYALYADQSILQHVKGDLNNYTPPVTRDRAAAIEAYKKEREEKDNIKNTNIDAIDDPIESFMDGAAVELFTIKETLNEWKNQFLQALSENEEAVSGPLTMKGIPINGKEKTFRIENGIAKFDFNDNGFFTGKEYTTLTVIKFGAFLTILQKICNISDGKNNTLLQFEMVEHISYWSNFPNLTGELDNTLIVTYPGNFSTDPNVCLIQHENYNNTIVPGINLNLSDSLVNKFLHKQSNDGISENLQNPSLVMRLSDVYININYIATQLRNLRGSKDDSGEYQDVSVLALVDSILSGVNTSLGGLNSFRVLFNENTSQIQILSENPILSNKTKSSESTPTTFNTMGFDTVGDNVGSFITSFDLNSELTDQMATQLSVSSQDNSTTIGENASSFSSYSKGLIDNLMVKKVYNLEKETDKSESIITKTEDKIQKIFDESGLSKAYDNVYNERKFSPDEYVDTLKQVGVNISSIIMGRYTQGVKGDDGKFIPASPSPFFLPFNMSLEMHGLGGMKIYESFQINGKGLPLSYDPKYIKLIIKSLSHTVNVDGWKTKISTISQPIFKVKATDGGSTSGGSGTTTSRNSSNKKSCKEKYGNEQYSATLGGLYPSLATYKFTGNDPRAGLSLQGKPLSSFNRLMKSSDGVPLPKAGYGVARKAFEALQVIGLTATSEGLTGLTVNSQYRSPVYNCTIGGVANSMHKTGGAIDIGTTNSRKLHKIILKLISQGKIPQGGVGLYNSFVHYDIRGISRRWYPINK